MSVASGPNPVTNGLVFEYDMTNTSRSWMGKPTTNLISISNWNNSLSGWAGWFWITGTTTMDPVNVLYPGVSVLNGQVTSNGTGGPAYLDLSGLSTTLGTTYTISVWFKSSNRTCYTYGHDTTGAGTVTGNSTVANGTWQKSSFVFTVVSTTGAVRIHLVVNSATAGDMIYVTAPQAELGSVASPFVDGTRSNTQSLLDATTNNTITSSSLTYGSNNTFSYNGSSNYTDCGNAPAIAAITGTSAVSVEAWVNLSGYGSTSGYGVITHKGYPWAWLMENPSNTMRIRFYLSSSGDVSCPDSSTHALNTWYQFVGTYDGSNMRFYRNGTLTNTVAGSGTLGGSGLNMVTGAYSGAYFAQGQIPVVKIYNRTLSASDVTQNFNAYRGRYGI